MLQPLRNGVNERVNGCGRVRRKKDFKQRGTLNHVQITAFIRHTLMGKRFAVIGSVKQVLRFLKA